MKRNVFVSAIIYIIPVLCVQAGDFNINESAFFSGHFDGRIPNCKLICVYSQDVFDNQEEIQISVPLDDSGNFTFLVPKIHNTQRIRLFLVDGMDYFKTLFSNSLPLLVQPGDSIHLSIPYYTDPDKELSEIKINGIGEERYKCLQEIFSIHERNTLLLGYKSPDKTKMLIAMDSLLNRKLEILKKYKLFFNTESFNIAVSDITGEMLMPQLEMLTNQLKNEPLPDYNKIADIYAYYRKVNRRNYLKYNKLVWASTRYLDFIILKNELELALSRKERQYEFMDIYHKLDSRYTGNQKERIMTYFFIMNDKRSGGKFVPILDPVQFSKCIKDSYESTQTPEFKSWLFKVARYSKGSKVFNFNFLKDSSIHTVSLSDLRGKVILLDGWSYSCGSCVEFSTAFHKQVFPLFKDNDLFAVVSVMIGGSREEYMSRLRNKNLDGSLLKNISYTSQEYINLYCGFDAPQFKAFTNYYHLNAAPFILLIDKKGRIYSASVPFFIDPNSPNVQKLIDLIKEAIAAR